MNIKKLLIALPAALAMHACSDDSDHDFQPSIDAQASQVQAGTASAALFDPTNAVLPFPSTLLLLGSDDNTVNIPTDAPDNLADPVVALNQLDGFSTTSPIAAPIVRALAPSSIEIGTSVVVYEVLSVPTLGFAPLNVISELTSDQMAAFSTDTNLILQPLVPLNASATYLVLLTDGLTDVAGDALARSRTYSLAAGEVDLTDPTAGRLQTLIRTHLSLATDQGIDQDSIVLSFTFNTQSIRETLQATKDASVPLDFVASFTGATTSNFIEGAGGHADVWTGTLDVPYYQTAGSADNPRAALDNFWTSADGNFLTRLNPIPEATGTETIPVLMSVPNADSTGGGAMPEAGWPVVIFQHGINQNRTDLLAVADSLADAGFAAVAIDMPMHGLFDDQLSAAETDFPTDQERHFNIDVINNTDPSDRAPDGIPDPSGTHFYQLDNLPNSRDNLRQAVADLFTLSDSLGGVRGAAADTPAIAFDTSRKAYVGHSLGAIVGSVFLSYDDTINSATLAMPGSGISQLLANSMGFGPLIVNGLASVGVEQGTAAFDQFLLAAQTSVDSGDPANHMSFLAALGTPVHMIEVLGDATIPNFVSTAPFSGTEPMAALLGLQPTTTSVNGSALVRFNAGDHSSILRSTASPAATVEMQTQMAIFAASGGTQLTITDSSVIADGLGDTQ